MTLTLPEFERQLQPLLAGWLVEKVRNGWRLQAPGRSVEISCQPLPVLRLGALELPRIDALIAFHGGSIEQEAAFTQDFLSHFRRGGG